MLSASLVDSVARACLQHAATGNMQCGCYSDQQLSIFLRGKRFHKDKLHYPLQHEYKRSVSTDRSSAPIVVQANGNCTAYRVIFEWDDKCKYSHFFVHAARLVRRLLVRDAPIVNPRERTLVVALNRGNLTRRSAQLRARQIRNQVKFLRHNIEVGIKVRTGAINLSNKFIEHLKQEFLLGVILQKNLYTLCEH